MQIALLSQFSRYNESFHGKVARLLCIKHGNYSMNGSRIKTQKTVRSLHWCNSWMPLNSTGIVAWNFFTKTFQSHQNFSPFSLTWKFFLCVNFFCFNFPCASWKSAVIWEFMKREKSSCIILQQWSVLESYARVVSLNSFFSAWTIGNVENFSLQSLFLLFEQLEVSTALQCIIWSLFSIQKFSNFPQTIFHAEIKIPSNIENQIFSNFHDKEKRFTFFRRRKENR